MKTKHLIWILLIVFAPLQMYPQLFKKKLTTVKVTVDPKTANIYANGEIAGQGSADITIPKDDCVKIQVGTQGWLWQTVNYCNKKKATNRPPKSKYFQLTRDEAFDASVSGSDIANLDIPIKVREGMNEEDAWRRMAQIITGYFDVIEVSDRETGYMRTAWYIKSFASATIRTRVIVKLANDDPLTYKIKIMSERANGPGVSGRADEAYDEWDRILRTFSGLIEEIQTRM